MARYVYGSRPNVPDLVIKGGNVYRLFVDQLGSPRMAVNVANTADVPYRVEYSAFGTATAMGATALDWIPFGFAGGLLDPDTGLVRFGARDYDPVLGRWVSKDPIRFGGGFNLYAYAGSDPVNRIDPTGLVAGVDDAAIVGGGAILLAGAAIYGILASNPDAVSDTLNWIEDGLGKVKDTVTGACEPAPIPAPAPDCRGARVRCTQGCIAEGMLEVNSDLGGNYGLQQCIDECLRLLGC